MSVSDNSTLSVARDGEGTYQSMDGHSYGVGDLAISSYEQSPYADSEIIALDVGPNQKRFRVHRPVLAQSSELDAKPALKLWGEKKNDTISLPELDETTAHTLIHYLYTGRFQWLKSYDDSTGSGKGVIPRYKLSTCVYCAAMRYKLAGLAELAQEKITSFSEDLTIFDVLSVAREHAFPLLPDNETWFTAYLESAIQGAVTQDPELPVKAEFVEQLKGDLKLYQLVMKVVMNTFSRSPTGSEAAHPLAPIAIKTAVEPSSRDDAKGDVTSTVSASESTPSVQPAPPRETAAPATTTKPAPTAQLETEHESVKLDDIEPIDSPTAPEPFTDELGFQNSRTYQTQKLVSTAANVSKKVEDTTTSTATAPAASAAPEKPAKPTATITPAVPEKLTKQTAAAPVSGDAAATLDAKVAPASKPAHTRTDSVMQVDVPAMAPRPAPVAVQEDKAPAKVETEVKSPDVVDNASPVVVDGTNGVVNGAVNGNTTPSKKSKKNKKKKGAAAA